MALSERLAIIIDANGAGAVREFDRVGKAAERELGKTEDSTRRLGASLTQVGAVMIGVGAVLVGGAFKAAQAFEQDQMAVLRLQNTLEKMPKLSGSTTDAFIEQASALQAVTKYGDDATISAQAMLGTFNMTESEILSLTPLVQDYASKFGVDLVEASKQVGKAVMGQRGALQRNGVTIDENLYKTDRFAAVTQALRDQAGGFAQVEGKTMAGQLSILKNNFGDVVEVVGSGAVGAFNNMLGPVKSLGEFFKDLPPVVGQTVGGFAAFGGVALIVGGAASVIIGQVMLMKERFTAAYGAAKRFFAFVRTQSLTTIGAVAGIAAAVVGAHFAMDALAKKLVENQFDVFRADSEQARLALEHFADSGQLLTSLSEDLQALRDNMNNTEAGVGGLAETLLDLDPSGIGQMLSLFDDYQDRAAADAVAEDLRQLDGWLTGMAQDSAPRAARAFEMVVEQLDLQGASVEELERLFPGYTGVQKDAAEATGALSTESQELTEALKEQQDALNALFDPVFAAIDATDGLRDAQNKAQGAAMEVAAAQQAHVDAVAQFGENSPEAVEAAFKLMEAQDKLSDAELGAVEAARRQESALLALAKSQAEGAVSTDAFEQQLQDWIDRGLITEDQARKVKDEFYRVRDAAGEIPHSTPANIESNVGDVVERIRELRGLIADTDLSTWGKIQQLAEMGRRELGGPVTARTPYLVGERGPELFVPDGSGRIIPDDETRRLMSGSSSSPAQTTVKESKTVNVYVNQSDASPYEIGRELLWQMKVAS